MAADRLLRLGDVAYRLNVSIGWLQRNTVRLREQNGFPAPIAALSRREHRYDPVAVDAWVARCRGVAPTAAVTDAGGGEQDWAAILDQRAAGFARPPGRA